MYTITQLNLSAGAPAAPSPSIAADILTLARCALFGAVWLFVGSLCGLSLIRMVLA